MSGRLVYLVCYDVCDPRRLRQVYKTMRAYGDHMQLSVFRCELAAADRVRMLTELEDIIQHNEDQVLIVPLGPPQGHNAISMETVGVPIAYPERYAKVV